jgi:ring-1,2-phenylacetyl-CoA epoxidase subunit PaaE
MASIKQLEGIITQVTDLTPTAREYTIVPCEPFSFTAGAFVNTFFEHNNTTIRRAFSLSSSDKNDSSFTLSIRLSPKGVLTPLLWDKDFINTKIRIMGPLGLNTADKITAKKIFLFGFGIGAGVVKSLADHMAKRTDLSELTIVTGNRSIDEILYRDYFDDLKNSNPNVSVLYVVSDKNQSQYKIGYIQDHLQSFNFEDADVYMCGQTIACTTLQKTIEALHPKNCRFFVEDFH